ncbi:MAG: GHMP kinase [Lachnospiraceae bacterium]|nr:GHMP kinase [Lachnospiraceae bacterium]
MRCVEKYIELYGCDPAHVDFCPYRISPLGAHVDHQGGHINGMAIDMGIHLAYSPEPDGSFELSSVNFDGKVRFTQQEIGEHARGDWADHCRGAVRMLAEKHEINIGLKGVLEGSFPIGGLSSSAGVIIVFMKAIAKLNNIALSDWELIELAKAAENRYVGVACGKLDQCCEVLSKKDSILFLDCDNDSYELIPKSGSSDAYDIAVFFSGLERSLASSAYNLRLDECRAAAYSLLEYAGLQRKTLAETRLRDVPRDAFDAYKGRLPEVFARRAQHFFDEDERAVLGAEAWRRGDIEEYGRLIFESGKSCIGLYECGCPELINMYGIMARTPGIYGGCFSGAGFKGSCMAFVEHGRTQEVTESVMREYIKAFPALKEKVVCAVCKSADGVGTE